MSTVGELAIGLGALVGVGFVLTKIAGDKGIGGNHSPINNLPPDNTGTQQSPGFGGTIMSVCEGPFLPAGTTRGKQVFLDPSTRPSCSGFTFANFLYTQQGWIDPNTGQPVDDGVNYQVWRCLNQITHIDDGWFYLSPNCA